MKKDPDISICIPTYNNREYLEKCLVSIFENTKEVSFEVIVCDDASSDGTLEMVSSLFPGVKLINNNSRLGYTGSMNSAIREVRGKYVLLLNNDTIFIDDPLNLLKKYMDENQMVGACTCRLLNLDGTPQIGFNVRRFPSLLVLIWEALLLDRLFPKQFLTKYYLALDFDFDLLQEVDQPAGTFLLVRKSVVEEVGLLDESMPNFYNDLDFCLRIRKNRWKIIYNPHASIYHHGGGSYLLLPKKEAMLMNYRDRFVFVRKHFGSVPLLVLKIALTMGMAIRMLLFWFLYLLLLNKKIGLRNVDPESSWEAFLSYKDIIKLAWNL